MPTFPQPLTGVLIEAANYTAQTGASYTALPGDFVLYNATGQASTVNLPVASLGAVVAVKKTDSSANAVTIQPSDEAGADTVTIDGIADGQLTLAKQFDTVVLASDGTNWWTVSAYLVTTEAAE